MARGPDNSLWPQSRQKHELKKKSIESFLFQTEDGSEAGRDQSNIFMVKLQVNFQFQFTFNVSEELATKLGSGPSLCWLSRNPADLVGSWKDLTPTG